MQHLRGGGEQSTANIEALFSNQSINGVGCSITERSSSYWGRPLLTMFGIPDGNPKYGVVAAEINIGDFLAVQGTAVSADSMEAFESGATDSTVEQTKQSIEAGEESSIPTPVMEIHRTGVVKIQEGRSRAIGARLAGNTRMPVWVAGQDYR